MPRNVTNSNPLVDPVAAWLCTPAPSYDAPSHTYGDQGVQLDPPGDGQPPDLLPPSDSTGQWHCPGHHPNPEGARYCAECGAPRVALPVSGAGVAVELAARPVPESLLTPAQKAERDRQHAAALREGATLPPLSYQPPAGTGKTTLIHMVEDGLTAFGQVWYRGQEIELDWGSERWRQAQAWINMTDAQQYERYGKVMFRPGPWPGQRSYTAGVGGFQRLGALGSGGQVEGPSEEQLRQADQAEARRRRGVPAPSLR